MEPRRMQTLIDFLTSRDAEGDRIGDGAKLGAWLHDQGLLADLPDVVNEDEVRAARHVRAALTGLVAQNSSHLAADPRTASTLAAATNAAPLVLTVSADGLLEVRPTGANVAGALSALVHLAYEAQLTGELERLKACQSCGVPFHDTTKNRSRRWCEMATCGSREKTRAYRARKKAAAESA
jgi:predicted RNA-binding Zn ribbon-like protein